MDNILRRVLSNLWGRRQPQLSFVSNLSYKNNLRLNRAAYTDFKNQCGKRLD
jgi:hypothetical protein